MTKKCFTVYMLILFLIIGGLTFSTTYLLIYWKPEKGEKNF